LLALRAMGVGIATLVVAFAAVPPLVRVVRVLSDGGYYVGPYWLTLPPNAIRWLPGLINILVFAASGWTTTRFHRSHGIAMVMPFAPVGVRISGDSCRQSCDVRRTMDDPDGAANRRHGFVAYAAGVDPARRPAWRH
jgi:hypothetical protein